MDRHIALKRAVRILLGLNVVIWFVFAGIVAWGLHPALPEGELVRWVLAGLAGAGALVLATLTILLERHRAFSYLVIGLLGIVAVVTFLDEFGFADLAFLIVTALPMALLMLEGRARGTGSLNPRERNS